LRVSRLPGEESADGHWPKRTVGMAQTMASHGAGAPVVMRRGESSAMSARHPRRLSAKEAVRFLQAIVKMQR